MADSKKYDGSQWEHSLRKLTTATAEIEPTIYTDGTAITSYTIKGNTVQSGTPTPSAPIAVQGVGELETTGEHSEEYKIPILTNQTTTNIYLGNVQSTRQIKKLVLTGGQDEQWSMSDSTFGKRFSITINGAKQSDTSTVATICSHLPLGVAGATYSITNTYTITAASVLYISRDGTYTSVADFKAWLATEYANGTPVTLWYAFAPTETGIVNEPLMKIGTYADTLSNAAQIPTTEGANSITVDTTVQPSEFTATWTGWHNATVKEWDGSDWQ